MSAITTKAKRERRTSKDMNDLLSGVLNILGEYSEPITVRHLFYRCANNGLIEKSQNAYNALRSHLVKWRRSKVIPYSAFIDGTRWHYGAEVFDNLGEYLEHAAAAYRLNLWAESDFYPEIWVEKEAVASMVASIAREWNLKVFVCRGDASMSSLARAAETFNYFRRMGKTPAIIYLGDYDENGLAIPKTIEANLAADHGCSVYMKRAAVNQDHIVSHDLPTRPPKGARRGESVEYAVDIDAMKPSIIRNLLTDEIEILIDREQLTRLKAVEAMEREALKTINLENLIWKNNP